MTSRQSRWIASRRAARGRAEPLEQLAGEGKRSRRALSPPAGSPEEPTGKWAVDGPFGYICRFQRE